MFYFINKNNKCDVCKYKYYLTTHTHMSEVEVYSVNKLTFWAMDKNVVGKKKFAAGGRGGGAWSWRHMPSFTSNRKLRQGMHMQIFSKVYCDRVYFLCTERIATGSGFRPPAAPPPPPPVHMKVECPPGIFAILSEFKPRPPIHWAMTVNSFFSNFQIPEWETIDCNQFGFNTSWECSEAMKAIGIPGNLTADGSYVFEKCRRYDVTGVPFSPDLDLRGVPTIPCDAGWEYDFDESTLSVNRDVSYLVAHCDWWRVESNFVEQTYWHKMSKQNCEDYCKTFSLLSKFVIHYIKVYM